MGRGVFQRSLQVCARKHSLKLCTEVVNRFESHFINIAADAVRFIDEVGEPNALIHLDTFHMIREEDSFAEAVRLCGKKLGYVHACESQRGIPGTGLVPWEEFFAALKSVGYDDWVTIESFTTELENVARALLHLAQTSRQPGTARIAGLGLS